MVLVFSGVYEVGIAELIRVRDSSESADEQQAVHVGRITVEGVCEGSSGLTGPKRVK